MKVYEPGAAMWRRHYWADIAGCRLSTEQLFGIVREEFAQLLPPDTLVGGEAALADGIDPGEIIALQAPLNGPVQVRAEDVRASGMTLVTLDHEPVSGAIRFLAERRGDQLRFVIQTYERIGNLLDRLLVLARNTALGNRTWREMLRRVVDRSGGVPAGDVQMSEEKLTSDQAVRIERWLDDVVAKRGGGAAHRGQAR